MTLLILVFGTLFLCNYANGDDFGYDGDHGPQHWGDSYKTCLGKYQSPIDIEDKDVRTTSYPPLKFFNVQDPHPAYMSNNGHTVMIRSTDQDPVNVPMVQGGPLNDTYVFQQLHFHWGKSDDEGSEDLINNHSFSMELHAVFWKKSYESSDEALKHPDGLTVLAFLYQATNESNPNFDTIVSQISEIATVGSNVTIGDADILNKLIAPNAMASQDYYTYSGSLTTPPCLEIVQWIDFIQPQTISHDQLAVFRSIKAPDGENLTHNYRPVQPLDDRIIFRNINNGSAETSKPAEVTDAPTTMQATNVPTTASTPKPMNPPTPKPTDPPTPKPTDPPTPKPTNPPTTAKPMTVAPQEATNDTMKSDKEDSQHSGQGRIWSTSTLVLVFGLSFLLPYQ
ncbi:carbonic anhydrase 2 isoform X2 [Halictus rubicundus]|uniref:carbonic anhydrase 2 isoform X2 n=1 Tax=Halictus rubicundus TaxID=77578 RepID=UPI004036387E